MTGPSLFPADRPHSDTLADLSPLGPGAWQALGMGRKTPSEAPRTPQERSAYDYRYRQARKQILASSPDCHRCGAPATETDHVPPIVTHFHVNGSGCCELLPACGRCQRSQGGALTRGRHRRSLRRRLPPASRRW